MSFLDNIWLFKFSTHYLWIFTFNLLTFSWSIFRFFLWYNMRLLMDKSQRCRHSQWLLLVSLLLGTDSCSMSRTATLKTIPKLTQMVGCSKFVCHDLFVPSFLPAQDSRNLSCFVSHKIILQTFVAQMSVC